jgi:hypothetical protein
MSSDLVAPRPLPLTDEPGGCELEATLRVAERSRLLDACPRERGVLLGREARQLGEHLRRRTLRRA